MSIILSQMVAYVYIIYNPGHNIVRYFDFRQNFRVTTSETNRDYYDLRKLGNMKKISKLHRIIAWCSVLLPKLKFCQYQQKIFEKQKLNFSRRVPFHRKTSVCLTCFGQDCSNVWCQKIELLDLMFHCNIAPFQVDFEHFCDYSS